MTAESPAGDTPESVLLDEPTTADLRAKVTEAWREFASALAGMLSSLPTGAQIDLTLDPTASGTGTAVYSVSVRVLPAGVIEALAVGNVYKRQAPSSPRRRPWPRSSPAPFVISTARRTRRSWSTSCTTRRTSRSTPARWPPPVPSRGWTCWAPTASS